MIPYCELILTCVSVGGGIVLCGVIFASYKVIQILRQENEIVSNKMLTLQEKNKKIMLAFSQISSPPPSKLSNST